MKIFSLTNCFAVPSVILYGQKFDNLTSCQCVSSQCLQDGIFKFSQVDSVYLQEDKLFGYSCPHYWDFKSGVMEFIPTNFYPPRICVVNEVRKALFRDQYPGSYNGTFSINLGFRNFTYQVSILDSYKSNLHPEPSFHLVATADNVAVKFGNFTRDESEADIVNILPDGTRHPLVLHPAYRRLYQVFKDTGKLPEDILLSPTGQFFKVDNEEEHAVFGNLLYHFGTQIRYEFYVNKSAIQMDYENYQYDIHKMIDHQGKELHVVRPMKQASYGAHRDENTFTIQPSLPQHFYHMNLGIHNVFYNQFGVISGDYWECYGWNPQWKYARDDELFLIDREEVFDRYRLSPYCIGHQPSPNQPMQQIQQFIILDEPSSTSIPNVLASGQVHHLEWHKEHYKNRKYNQRPYYHLALLLNFHNAKVEILENDSRDDL